jgi:hypothetical protein
MSRIRWWSVNVPVADHRTTSQPTAMANASAISIGISDPDDEHHRRPDQTERTQVWAPGVPLEDQVGQHDRDEHGEDHVLADLAFPVGDVGPENAPH